KVAQRNPTVRIGVIEGESEQTRWIDLPGDPQQHYVPRLHFLPVKSPEDSDPRILIQQLNRLQNANRLFLADFRSGVVSDVLTESDDAWVDVHDELNWINEGGEFTWLSERSGWRHLYIATLDGELRQITKGDFDVIQLLHVNEQDQLAYFIASPGSPTQRKLFQVRLDGSGLQQLTREDSPGTHSYMVSDDGQWAVHSHSTADQPPVVEMMKLKERRDARVLLSNEELEQKLKKLDPVETEFFRVDIGEGVELDAWCMRAKNLDLSKRHPLLVYVYGEPAGSTVVNRWGAKSSLWHRMLAERGYVVMSFDNRGTKAPRGRAWRKSIYKKIGIIPPQDQARAVEAVLKERSYLDPNRVGIWGWSGGGSSSLHAVFKYPKLYSTAIAVAPVPNQRYYDTIYQERYMSLPELNVEGFREGSAINFAKQLEGNLLLIHGTGDDNCHYQTTELLIDELIANNKQFQMMSYPNRTHSIRERKNTTRHLRQLMTDYLEQHLPTKESDAH
ncbi:MAG: prolyl oligopeptidase family serine peptidase, partial [Rubripirellula sp.]